MHKDTELPNPLNTNERLLHAIAMRQDIMIEQLNSLIEHVARQDKLAVTNHKAVEKTVTPVVKTAVKAEGVTATTTRKRTTAKPKQSKE